MFSHQASYCYLQIQKNIFSIVAINSNRMVYFFMDSLCSDKKSHVQVIWAYCFKSELLGLRNDLEGAQRTFQHKQYDLIKGLAYTGIYVC